MSHDTNDPLHVLEREAVPPRGLKGRITQSLRDRGLLRSTRPGWRRMGRTVGAIAAAILLFATGVGIGRRSVTPARDTRPSYMLLLYEGRDFDLDRSRPGDLAAHEAEYDAWARGLKARGVGVQGRALALTAHVLHNTPQGVQVESGDVGRDAIDGFFIIRVSDEAEAVAIARTHPHLRHGGWIALRPIKQTS
ncbi:MAG TPA: hypothetical protein VNH14_07780 [Gemmatimonadales bacterium]|nr:hypothetical protein [Gemmatimonadales bacterium]